MPSFVLTARAQAPVEEVWKLLHDPARFPEWWAGVETVRPDGRDHFTLWPAGYPDFPMAQRLRTEQRELLTESISRLAALAVLGASAS